MKVILLSLIFTLNFASALEFTPGEYELISGDENICEDGAIQIVKSDLKIGSRYLFPNFKKDEYTFSSDDKSCEYQIKNIHSAKIYQQELKQICKKESDSFKRVIEFSYFSKNELHMKVLKNQKEEICKLKLTK